MARASEGPGRAFHAFGEAVSRGDLVGATSCFARDACFLTPDATIVQGRDEIRGILAQLIAMNLRLRTEPRNLMTIGDVALSSEPLTLRYETCRGEQLTRSPRATIVMRQIERNWKLLFAALWGWG